MYSHLWLSILLPGAPLTYFNDGGVRQRFIFYTQENHNLRICLPKKITTSEFVYPKKSLLYLAYPKNSLSPFFATPQKSLCCFFSRPKKIPASFTDPKRLLWPKFQTQKSHSAPPPPVIKICEWGPWDPAFAGLTPSCFRRACNIPMGNGQYSITYLNYTKTVFSFVTRKGYIFRVIQIYIF